jgi:CO/xanthine dehydrogenase FAD-binding subunit
VAEARIVLGAVSMQPLDAADAAAALVGKRLTDDVIAAAADSAARLAKPMDNTDFVLHWRKKVANSFVTHALREIRGDDMADVRRRIARHELVDA